MLSKIELRDIIQNKKDEYFKNDDMYAIIEAAIYKGYYKAIKGEKAIAIPNKYNTLVDISELIIKASLKDRDIVTTYTFFAKNNVYVDLSNTGIEVSNNDLARIFVDLVIQSYNDSLIMTREVLYRTIKDILDNQL